MAQRAQSLVAGEALLTVESRKRNRLMAVEIRSGKFGYAVFEKPTELVDWGVRWFGARSRSLAATVSNRIRIPLNIHKPFAVVVRDREYYTATENKRFRTILRLIRAEAKQHSTKLRIITTRQVRRHFALRGGETKHDIAASLARQFNHLSWRAPRRRRLYQSEARAMVIFDAVAIGVTFFGRMAPQEDHSQSIA